MAKASEVFNQVCTEAKAAEGHYVALMQDERYYGGPEEGGWFGHDVSVVAYQYFATEEAANAAKERVLRLAEELNEDAVRAEGSHCLLTMEWLDARGLDASFLPEPDGPARYFVIVTDELPENSYGPTHYE